MSTECWSPVAGCAAAEVGVADVPELPLGVDADAVDWVF
jgi:hypothetical protein